MKKSKISIEVSLDEQNIPESMVWSADDNQNGAPQITKAISLSFWDGTKQDALSLDLWTKDMRLDEMDTHFFQTLVTLAESYQKATKNDFVVDEMNKFCKSLADKINESTSKP